MPSFASLPKASRWPPRLGLLGLAVMLAPLVFPEGTLRSYDWDLQLIWITRFHQALEAGLGGLNNQVQHSEGFVLI